jgi:hypothetical protein
LAARFLRDARIVPIPKKLDAEFSGIDEPASVCGLSCSDRCDDVVRLVFDWNVVFIEFAR